MRKIASIEIDVPIAQDEDEDMADMPDYKAPCRHRRADIIYSDGKIYCDGNDITPSERPLTLAQARRDVAKMYGMDCWKLKLKK